MADRPPSTFTLWLEEALSGWILPVAALGAVAVVGLLYMAGIASETATATLVIVAVALGVALYLARAALDPRADRAARGLAAAAAVATLVAAGLPAIRTVNPGAPVFSGTLGQADDAMPLPADAGGSVRLLVSGRLAERGDPSVEFTLGGTREPVDGKLERTYGYARVGRGGRTRVSHDHTSDFYPAYIPHGTKALTLSRIVGQLGGRLTVTGYREPLPLPWGPWVAAGVAVLLAGAAEARLGRKSDLSVAAGMASAFGLLVTFNATPASSVGPAVGGIVLGALTGALAGWIVGIVARRALPAAPRREAGGKGERASTPPLRGYAQRERK
jgi:hypothetical protein